MKKLIFLIVCAFAFTKATYANVNAPPTDNALVYKEVQVRQADAVIEFTMCENPVWYFYPPLNQTVIVITKNDAAGQTEIATVPVLLTERVNSLEVCLVSNTDAQEQTKCDYTRVGYSMAY